MPRRAVVTGGAGFLGSHLCERLLREGYEVVCLDNFLTGTPANVGHLLEDPAFRLVRCDVTDYVHVVGDVDAVLHFASPASPIDYLKLPIQTLKVGSIGTMHALGLAREKGARFLLASTSETYGDPEIHPQPESYWGNVNPVGPRGVYDEAKRFAEAMTMAYRRHHGVDTTIVRIFNSVLGTEKLLVDDGEQLLHLTADELAQRIGTEAPLAGWSVPAFSRGGAVNAREATWFIGHPTTKRSFRVHTRYGRSLAVTADHSLFVPEGPGLEPTPRAVSELAVGDRVAISARVDVPERDRKIVDLLDVVAGRGVDPWRVGITWPGLGSVVHERRAELVASVRSRCGGASRQSCWAYVVRWRRNGALPLGAVQAVGIGIPAEARLRALTARRRSWLPRIVEVTDDVLWLLGLIVAAGWTAESHRTTAVHLACDDATLDRAERVIEEHLGCQVVRSAAAPARTPELAVNGPLVVRLLEHLDLVPGPQRIPAWILGLPLSRLKWFLEGYREADGARSGQTPAAGVRHEFSAVSDTLRDDLVVALARFGLLPSVSRWGTTWEQRTGDRRAPLWRLALYDLSPWSPLEWDEGVVQRLDAARTGDLVWAGVTKIEEVPSTPLVYDFCVPGRENFWAGTGVMAHNTFGPRMRPNDGRAIPAFISQALRGDPVTVAGDGSQTRSVCYVDDLIDGIVRLLHAAHPGPVNLGNPHEMSMLELARWIIKLTGSGSEVVFIPRPEDDPTVRQPDITLARTELGWEPRVPVEEGLRRTIDWFRAHPQLVAAASTTP